MALRHDSGQADLGHGQGIAVPRRLKRLDHAHQGDIDRLSTGIFKVLGTDLAESGQRVTM
jgi:hypothetical protein